MKCKSKDCAVPSTPRGEHGRVSRFPAKLVSRLQDIVVGLGVICTAVKQPSFSSWQC